jgi:hypothetical protein
VTPAYQTRFGDAGDCFAACVASVLGLPTADVPDFRGRGWPPRLRAWLAARGRRVTFAAEPPAGYAVCSRRVFDGNIHAVVTHDGRVVHDPNGRPLWSADDKILLWTVIR